MIDSAAAEAAIAMPPEPDGRPPVLLVHGTDSATDESWSTTYVPALTAAGFAVFTINLPDRALADIQVSAEYVVYAVRRVAGMTGRKLAIIGHSQGGLEPRWALRWWPDLRDQVSDVISLGTPQHGTVSADLNCAVGCAAAVWQMTQGSQLLAALNRDVETPGTAGYTSIYSATDELVQPQIPQSTSALDGAANILVQDLCPGRPVNHVGLMRDAVVYALALDALTHDGPADASRIPITVCAQVIIPGVDPVAQFDAEMDFLISFTRDSSAFNTDSEPPLRDYAQAGGS